MDYSHGVFVIKFSDSILKPHQKEAKILYFSSTISGKATIYKFSHPGYRGSIEIAFFPKTNTFSDRRKEVI